MFDLLHDEDWSLDCRCCLHFRLLSNPHVSNKVLMLMMMIVRNKDNCILNNTAPVPWPSPLTRVVSLDSLSPVLSLTDVCDSWLPPQLVTSLEPPLGPGWHPRSHMLIFTYPAQEINCLNLITMEDGTVAPLLETISLLLIVGVHYPRSTRLCLSLVIIRQACSRLT